MRDRGWRRFTAWKKGQENAANHPAGAVFRLQLPDDPGAEEKPCSYTYIKGCYREQLRRTLKRQSRKKLRHTKDLPLRGNGFHKCFDY